MTVSIITPSFQQASFIERTLESVWKQRQTLPGIEHIVMDGGSTDGTLDILHRWKDRIQFSSGPDDGQTAAINAGLAVARGEILAYLNSDDVLYERALARVASAFAANPDVDVVYGQADLIDEADRIVGAYPTEPWSLQRLKLICFLCQPATFFRRRTLERFGDFDSRLQYCMDYEYWLRLATRGAQFLYLPEKLAAARNHGAAKTQRFRRQAHVEINDVLKRVFGVVPDNWLTNYACAVLDAQGVRRSRNAAYVSRLTLHALYAAFRWNGLPSARDVRAIGSLLRSTLRETA